MNETVLLVYKVVKLTTEAEKIYLSQVQEVPTKLQNESHKI